MTEPASTDTPSDDDPLLARLSELPLHDVDAPDASARRALRARHAFEREARLAERPALRRASHLYARVVEPSAVAALAIVYLAWAIARVIQLVG